MRGGAARAARCAPCGAAPSPSSSPRAFRPEGHYRSPSLRIPLPRGERDTLVAIMLRLEWTRRGDAEILGLLGRELGQLDADLLQVQRRHLLVEALGQHVDLPGILLVLLPPLDLR